MSVHKYVISTTSTSGSSASIKVETYIDNVLTTTTNMSYRNYQGTWKNFDDLIRIGYNTVVTTNWTCQILGDIVGYNVGQNISWGYGTWKNLTLEETPPVSITAFLIESEGTYYTIQNDALVSVGSTLNKALFVNNGLADIPEWNKYSSLANPSILCYDTDSAKNMTADVVGVPNPKTITGINLSKPDLKIKKVNVTSDDNSLFAVTFDNGSTWWKYTNDTWSQVSSITDGMTKSEFTSIPVAQWDSKVDGQLNVRCTLLDETGYLNQIEIKYLSGGEIIDYLSVVNGAVNITFDDGN